MKSMWHLAIVHIDYEFAHRIFVSAFVVVDSMMALHEN